MPLAGMTDTCVVHVPALVALWPQLDRTSSGREHTGVGLRLLPLHGQRSKGFGLFPVFGYCSLESRGR